LLDELGEMHTYCRPAGSRAERQFITRYVAPLPGAVCDAYGNWHVEVGESTTLFSCHTDTVHGRSGRQRVELDRAGRLGLTAGRRRACLGADDTAGVFLCRQMIRRGIPGRYIFHAGEEIGCVGSSALAADPARPLARYQAAVAFDRGGTTDVITHQCGQETCSPAFAAALAAALGLGYTPSPHGIYTDTREYADLIPECTNLSVGYTGAHSPAETLDVGHVAALLAAVCALEWAALPIDRDPAAEAAGDAWEAGEESLQPWWMTDDRAFLTSDWRDIQGALQALRGRR
jgi:hypothetical protein